MNQHHLGKDAVTVYESLEDAGLVAAAVNITCYRGRTRHLPTLPWVTKPAYGPKRFFFYSLFESDPTGAPLAVRNRAGGSIDAYAAAVGRWLVTRDGFDFLAYYLSDFDFASHAHGPEGAEEVALERTDAAIQALLDAAGGVDEFLERYAVILLSDHGQTDVEQVAQLETPLAAFAGEIVVTASNRAGQVYLRPGARAGAAQLAQRLDGEASVEMTLRREGANAVARRDGEELRFRPSADGWETSGDTADPRPSGRPAPLLVGARQPERRRAARLRGRGMGAGGPRRPPPRGRRQPRLARRGRLDRAGAHDRRRCRSPRGSPTSRPRCSRTSASSRRRTHGRSSMPADLAARRRRMVDEQIYAPRHRRRARARGDGARSARALRAGGAARPRLRRRRAADRRRADDLAAVHGRAHLRRARPARRRACARRRHGLGLPGRRARRAGGRGALDRADSGAGGAGAR